MERYEAVSVKMPQKKVEPRLQSSFNFQQEVKGLFLLETTWWGATTKLGNKKVHIYGGEGYEKISIIGSSCRWFGFRSVEKSSGALFRLHLEIYKN